MMQRIIGLALVMLVLAACGGAPSGGDAAGVVLKYLEAKVAGDADGVRQNICSEMEARVTAEAASFASVEATLQDAVCKADGDSKVSCTGAIVATYNNGETNEFALSSYRVVQEDGAWKWCGEAQ